MGLTLSTLKDNCNYILEYERFSRLVKGLLDDEKLITESNDMSSAMEDKELIKDFESQENSRESALNGMTDRNLDMLESCIKKEETGNLEDVSVSCRSFKLSNGDSSPNSVNENAAAVTVQKVYRSYRTRRNLADCAVFVEELWWQAIEYTTLKKNSCGYFNVNKQDTPSARWLRARIKASKVGRGLSKDENASQLAFQHWLEAIDPRHRYGRNLHFYYDVWFDSDTTEPFFYWLDVGDGKSLDLQECPRSKLQKERIKYLGPAEREQYEIVPKDGKLVYYQSGDLVDTRNGSKDSKWIFVMSTSKRLYTGQKKRGTFQHSSFLAGAAISAAGRFIVEDGVLKAIWPYSGHYHPTEQNYSEVLSFFEENGLDLTNVKKGSFLEDEQQNESSAEPKIVKSKKSKSSRTKEIVNQSADRLNTSLSADIDVTEGSGILHNSEEMKVSNTEPQHEKNFQEAVLYKRSLSGEFEEQKPEVPPAKLIERINSKKSIKSYQLGKQLTLKWTSGVGPRIGWVADYPEELRNIALERVSLSPRPGSPSTYQSPRSLSLSHCQSPRPGSPSTYQSPRSLSLSHCQSPISNAQSADIRQPQNV